MKKIFLVLFIFFLYAGNTQNKQRLIILADMGNEPDEEQQMMHMLMYANEFDLEGLIAVTGKFLNPNSSNPEKQRLYPELFLKLIEGYSKVIDNLKKHADDWPEPEYLSSIVVSGQKGYGYQDVGNGKSSKGSELIIKAIKKQDKRPIYIVVNAGSNTLAQALFDLENEVSKKEFNKYLSKLRVYENGAQDNAGAYICSKYPNIFWIRSNYQTYCYAGPGVDGGYNNQGNGKNLGPYTWKPYAYSGIGQHQWLLENVIGNHGPFGNYYPIRQFKKGGISFMEGGGTIPWLGLINKGLFSMDNPHWGSWSGRYTKDKVKNEFSKHESVNKDEHQFMPFYMYTDATDTWTTPEGTTSKNIFNPVFRWRKAYLNDFKCRMDWCTQSFENANHNPNISINGNSENTIQYLKVKPNEMLFFDASESNDPDGDSLDFNWWIYKEASSYTKTIDVDNSNSNKITFVVPKDAKNSIIHLILEVKDNNKIASMYNYRRLILNIE